MIDDREALRAEFPVTESWAYLNHASYGPLSRRTVAAIEQVTRASSKPLRATLHHDHADHSIVITRIGHHDQPDR
jgi:hypothetical protein